MHIFTYVLSKECTGSHGGGFHGLKAMQRSHDGALFIESIIYDSEKEKEAFNLQPENNQSGKF